MPCIAKELKPAQIAALKPKHADRPTAYPVGGVAGLYIQITPGGARSWFLKTTIGGKRRHVGLGSYPEVRPGEARDKAREAKAKVAAGIDPIEERKAAREALKAAQGRMTFREAVEKYLAAKLAEFRNDKHKAQWRATLDTYAAPVIGTKPVADLTPQDVLAVLQPIWTTKNETASRLRGRVEAVLSWATVNGHREGDNPARWRGNLSELLPKPSKVAKKKHRPALALGDVPRWWAELRQREGMAARALEFVMLTGARSGEVRGMTWGEVDIDGGVWTIRGDRMKAGRPHRVALPAEAVAVLKALPRRAGTDLVFPALRGGMLSDMTIRAVMLRMQEDEVKAKRPGFLDPVSKRPAVPHGLRSTFRQWAAEQGHDRDMAEMQLAHFVGSAVERAYQRSDMLERRRDMMAAWAAFVNA